MGRREEDDVVRALRRYHGEFNPAPRDFWWGVALVASLTAVLALTVVCCGGLLLVAASPH